MAYEAKTKSAPLPVGWLGTVVPEARRVEAARLLQIFGEVTEINWRATRLRNQQGNVTIMPNSKLAAAQIVNFNYPGPRYRAQIELTIDARVPPGRAAELIIAAAEAREAAPRRSAS